MQKVQERGREGRRRLVWAVGGNFMGGRGKTGSKAEEREGGGGRKGGRGKVGRKQRKYGTHKEQKGLREL